MRPRLPLVVLLLVTAAQAESPPPVYDLPVTVKTLKVDKASVSIEYFVVAAPTPLVEKAINHRVAADAGVFAVAQTSGPRQFSAYRTCKVGLATNVFVSYSCRGINSKRSFAYYLDGAKLRPATFDDLFVPRPDLRQQLSLLTQGLPVDAALDFFVAPDGIVVAPPDSPNRSDFPLPRKTIEPYLAKNNPYAITTGSRPWLDADGMHARAKAVTEPRFVPGPGGIVTDRLTGLEWANRDNGQNVTWQQAGAYAKAFRGGGHDDWRLPTLEEVAALSDPDDDQHPTDDCAKGEYHYGLTPLIHLSCGLAWTDTGDMGKLNAFGFVSRTARWSEASASTNYRALPVRTAQAATSPTYAVPAAPGVLAIDWLPIPGRGLAIARTETTAAQYQRCADMLRCRPAFPSRDDPWPQRGTYDVKGKESHPINNVSWEDAANFCHFAGGRLPTGAEWSFAATGGDQRKFPWGTDSPPAGTLVGNFDTVADGFEFTAPVGHFAAGRGPFGLDDMAGNVREWVADKEPKSGHHFYRGTSFEEGVMGNLVWFSASDTSYAAIGFRCSRP